MLREEHVFRAQRKFCAENLETGLAFPKQRIIACRIIARLTCILVARNAIHYTTLHFPNQPEESTRQQNLSLTAKFRNPIGAIECINVSLSMISFFKSDLIDKLQEQGIIDCYILRFQFLLISHFDFKVVK